MKRSVMIGLSLFLGLGVCLSGCKREEPSGGSSAVQKDTRIMVCAKCGEIKGSERCCKAGVEKCPYCGLNKGSAACCKNINFRRGDVELCPQCGEVKGSRRCCVLAAEKCPTCGLHKNSPGCCRIKKAD